MRGKVSLEWKDIVRVVARDEEHIDTKFHIQNCGELRIDIDRVKNKLQEDNVRRDSEMESWG